MPEMDHYFIIRINGEILAQAQEEYPSLYDHAGNPSTWTPRSLINALSPLETAGGVHIEYLKERP